MPSGVWGNPDGTCPLLWQVDYYRCGSGWLPGEVALKDPGTVAWILLDRKGRSAAELFWDAHTAHVWQTVSYDAFASKLLDGYDQAAAARDDRQAEELKQLICMLAW